MDRLAKVASGSGRSTAVYMFYDAAGALLYVGITSQGPKRFSQHNRDKEWWPEVTTMRVEHYPSRDLAAAREKALIQSKHPRYNVIHQMTGSVRRGTQGAPKGKNRSKKASQQSAQRGLSLAPGLQLNVNESGIGLRFGVPGPRISSSLGTGLRWDTSANRGRR